MKHKERKTVSNCSLSRRSFLKNSALATAALTVNPSAIFADAKKPTDPKSIVVISENKKAITESYKIDSRRVREMIDEGIKALTNTKSSKEGWLEIFPNLKARR
ncbi:MAG: twin-arginine translocation signal domain-containing protein [Deltaproteobacteria bacterium]|nr:twin-arginine translocation signal domain-containing protein [Deltaproteobacteria bacterium]